jgi:beta-phosphoglucomutase
VADRHVFREVWQARDPAVPPDLIEGLVAEKAAVLRTVLTKARPLFPGVAEMIRAWAAVVPLAIASGSLRGEIDSVLGAAGLGSTVRIIVSAEDVTRSKPAPDPYVTALARLRPLVGDLIPARTVAIEDSRWGLDSARAAGMRTVAVTTSAPGPELRAADLVVDGVTSLTLGALDALCA